MHNVHLRFVILLKCIWFSQSTNRKMLKLVTENKHVTFLKEYNQYEACEYKRTPVATWTAERMPEMPETFFDKHSNCERLIRSSKSPIEIEIKGIQY